MYLPGRVRKRPYCDFNSHERGTALPEDEYVAALKYQLIINVKATKAIGRTIPRSVLVRADEVIR